MEIDRDILLAVVKHFLRTLSELEGELAAHRRLILWSRRGPGTGDAMDLLLDHARKSVAPPEHVQKVLDEHLEAISNHLADELATPNHKDQCTVLSITQTSRGRIN